MVQNAMQFAPKRSAFCRKTQSILVQNAVHFGAKREAISINIHYKCIDNTYLLH